MGSNPTICPHCEAPNTVETDEGVWQCEECGHEFSAAASEEPTDQDESMDSGPTAAEELVCPKCGADLDVPDGVTVLKCRSCGSKLRLRETESVRALASMEGGSGSANASGAGKNVRLAKRLRANPSSSAIAAQSKTAAGRGISRKQWALVAAVVAVGVGYCAWAAYSSYANSHPGWSPFNSTPNNSSAENSVQRAITEFVNETQTRGLGPDDLFAEFQRRVLGSTEIGKLPPGSSALRRSNAMEQLFKSSEFDAFKQRRNELVDARRTSGDLRLRAQIVTKKFMIGKPLADDAGKLQVVDENLRAAILVVPSDVAAKLQYGWVTVRVIPDDELEIVTYNGYGTPMGSRYLPQFEYTKQESVPVEDANKADKECERQEAVYKEARQRFAGLLLGAAR